MEHRNVTLITGASGGIGADLARVFAQNNHDLALVARNSVLLERLADDIEQSGRPRPLTIALDLSKPSACGALASELEKSGAAVDILVNNAGFGLVGFAQKLDAAEQIEMIDLNVRSLTELTLHFLPQITAARGKILNVASVVAFLPGPGMAVYCATKAYVLSFSEALSSELASAGVVVTVLCPGLTRTGFQARAGIDADKLKSMPGMSSMAVAEAGYAGLMAGRRRVTPGLLNKIAVAMLRFIPHALLLPAMARLQARRTVS